MSGTKPFIAIVDDDRSVCRAIGRLVRSAGMNAESFTSGQEFIDFIEAMSRLEVDCVVLDVQMPGITGLDVQDRLKQLNRPAPVVFITAHDDVGVRERAISAGAVAFLRKPFDDELFLKTLNQALAQGAGENPNGSSKRSS